MLSIYSSFTFSASDDVDGLTAGDVSVSGAGGSSVTLTYSISATGDAGDMTVGDITVVGTDKTVAAAGGGFGAADVGKHYDGADLNLYFYLYGTDDGDLTVGDIDITLDTLSDVSISLSQTSSGDVIIGDLTVSGALGMETYTGTAADETGSFALNVTTFGTITIGDVDFSGYEADTTALSTYGPIDLSWTDAGAASIVGSDNKDVIIGNAAANKIAGGKDVDAQTGGAGNDTFVFPKGDALPGATGLAADTDNITDWTGDDLTATVGDMLAFGGAAGSATNYLEGGAYGSYAAFLAAAADGLDSTIKYFAGTFGANLYVAANQGSGEADSVVMIIGGTLASITYADIVAGS